MYFLPRLAQITLPSIRKPLAKVGTNCSCRDQKTRRQTPKTPYEFHLKLGDSDLTNRSITSINFKVKPAGAAQVRTGAQFSLAKHQKTRRQTQETPYEFHLKLGNSDLIIVP